MPEPTPENKPSHSDPSLGEESFATREEKEAFSAIFADPEFIANLKESLEQFNAGRYDIFKPS